MCRRPLVSRADIFELSIEKEGFFLVMLLTLIACTPCDDDNYEH